MKKTLCCFFAFIIVLSLFTLGGCGEKKDSNAVSLQSNENSSKRTIQDATGKTVEIPKKVEKIAITCYGGATHELVVLGAEDMIVAQPTMEKFPQLMKMKPHFKDVVDAGSFDNANIEELLKVEPDVVFGGITAEKGNAKIKEAGIPVVTMLIGRANIEGLKQEFMNTGKILGKEDKAKRLVTYWDEKIKLINDRVSQIPKEKRKRVYYAGGQLLKTEGGQWWTNELVNTSGGIFVSKDLGTSREISIEQLINWDPDVIIVSREGDKSSIAREIKKDPRVRDLKAVKKGAVYDFPMGAFWWNRPSPEAPLGFMWLAKTLYPDETKDIDLKAETKKFYKEFYEYDLSDEEYESFIKQL